MSPNLSEKFVAKQLAEEYDYLAPDRSEIRLLAQVNGWRPGALRSADWGSVHGSDSSDGRGTLVLRIRPG